MTNTRQQAEYQIGRDIERQGTATAAEFDIQAIADDLYRLTRSWHFDRLDEHIFWATVESHALAVGGAIVPEPGREKGGITRGWLHETRTTIDHSGK